MSLLVWDIRWHVAGRLSGGSGAAAGATAGAAAAWGYAGAAALLLPAGGVWSRRPQSTLSTAVSRLSVSRRDRFHLSSVNPLQCDEPRLQRSWLTYGFRWPPWWSRPCSTGAATVGTFSAFCCCSLTRTCCHLPGVGDELAASRS